MFIVLEGVDGSGKTTQLEAIKKHIKKMHPDKTLIVTREPGGAGNPLGEELRAIILNNDMHDFTRALLYAASRYEHQKKIKEWIDEGYIVVCDRYIYSSMAYQTNDKLSMEEIMQINRYDDIIKPDYIFFYSITMDTYRDRKYNRQKDRELDAIEKKSDEFFMNVMDKYTIALDKIDQCKIIKINANKSLEEVTSSTIKNIEELIKED